VNVAAVNLIAPDPRIIDEAGRRQHDRTGRDGQGGSSSFRVGRRCRKLFHNTVSRKRLEDLSTGWSPLAMLLIKHL
jgi:hypothetical protein